MTKKFKIAGVQMNPAISDVKKNRVTCLESLKRAAASGAGLIIFPEAALTGYCYVSLDEAKPLAETVPGPSTEIIARVCQATKTYAIIGLIEKEKERYYNTAVLLSPQGVEAKYRKLHLPYLGIDRFIHHGDLPLETHKTDIGNIGMGICYDLAFPEHSRVLALEGADMVVNITNWPGATTDPNFIRLVHVRAYENTIYYVAVNRVGTERSWSFFGSSIVVDPLGKLIFQAKQNEEDFFLVDIDPTLSRQKHQITIPGELEVDRIRDRRPNLYNKISQPLVDSSRIRQ